MKRNDPVMLGVRTGRVMQVRGPRATVRWFDGSFSTVELAKLKPAAGSACGPRLP